MLSSRESCFDWMLLSVLHLTRSAMIVVLFLVETISSLALFVSALYRDCSSEESSVCSLRFRSKIEEISVRI